MIDYKEQMNDPRWVERSREIMKRDNFTCQLCGKSHTKLNVHHIRYIKGKDYWDYPDELLMTVCETCHQKIHGKYDYMAVNKKSSTNKSKKVIFRNLFMSDKLYKLSYNEQVVLSALIWDSMKQQEVDFYEIWVDKKSNDFIEKFIKSDLVILNSELRKSKWIEGECSLPHVSVSVALKTLKNKGIIEIDKDKFNLKISVDKSIFDGGYIDLIYPSEEYTEYIDNKTNKVVKINSHDIILYSYLKFKAKHHLGEIDTYVSKLACELSVCERDMKRYLARLKSFGLIERLENGKLKIN